MKKVLIMPLAVCAVQCVLCMHRPSTAPSQSPFRDLAAASQEQARDKGVDDLAVLLEQLPPISRSKLKPGFAISFLEQYATQAEEGTLDLLDSHVSSIAEREVRKVFEKPAASVDTVSYQYAVKILAYMSQKKHRFNEALGRLIQQRATELKSHHEETAAKTIEREAKEALLAKQLELIAIEAGGLPRSQSPAKGYATPDDFYGTLVRHHLFDHKE